MGGTMSENFKVEEHFIGLKDDEVILFDKFYEALSKWAISQDKITYN
jgi:hypothetical protein